MFYKTYTTSVGSGISKRLDAIKEMQVKVIQRFRERTEIIPVVDLLQYWIDNWTVKDCKKWYWYYDINVEINYNVITIKIGIDAENVYIWSDGKIGKGGNYGNCVYPELTWLTFAEIKIDLSGENVNFACVKDKLLTEDIANLFNNLTRYGEIAVPLHNFLKNSLIAPFCILGNVNKGGNRNFNIYFKDSLYSCYVNITLLKQYLKLKEI